jgi:hypothetical protein
MGNRGLWRWQKIEMGEKIERAGKKTKDIFEEIYPSCLDINVKKLKKRNIRTKIGD